MSLNSINPSPYKIYALVPLEDMPKDLANCVPYGINFKTGLVTNLKKKTTVRLGERIKSEYYRYFEPETKVYQDLILKVEYQFVRNDRGYLTQKRKSIFWLKEDGSWGEYPKTETSFYNSEAEQIAEIKRRRSNIVTELLGLAKKYATPELDLESKITEIFEKYQTEKDSYVDAGSAQFRNAIASDSATWLDETVEATGNTSRDVITQYLTI